MNVIEISHITKDYGQNRGVFDVSFSVKQGEVLGFLGPNGAGKTTTIRQLMGFIKPDKGSLSILDMDCFKESDKIQTSLGYLPGEIAFIDSMTGMEFIRFVAKMKNMRDMGRAQELMKMFELNASGKLKKMSKGMKQKIGIVCAFMNPLASILILDEPTSGLDPLMQNRFVELIQEEKARGKTILMSSHMFEEVERTCDRVAILKEGRLAAVDSVAALKKTRRRSYTVVFPTTEQAAAFAAEWDGVLTVGGRRVTAAVQDGLLPFLQALERHGAEDLDADRQSLEDVFMQYYGGDRP